MVPDTEEMPEEQTGGTSQVKPPTNTASDDDYPTLIGEARSITVSVRAVVVRFYDGRVTTFPNHCLADVTCTRLTDQGMLIHIVGVSKAAICKLDNFGAALYEAPDGTALKVHCGHVGIVRAGEKDDK
jgi:hypothetical protein